MTVARPRNSHIWPLDPRGHYVEPEWCSTRLLATEHFAGTVLDPCAGWGRIVQAARAAGLKAYAGDIVDRGFPLDHEIDFQNYTTTHDCIIANPPYSLVRQFAEHALELANYKVAMLWPCRRLNAAGKWLTRTPLSRVLYLTPRPSMPPGSHIKAGGKIGNGKQDFAWLIWTRGHNDKPAIDWLHRDGGQP